MADISKIDFGDGVERNIKDAVARGVTLTDTLAAGATSLTFTDASITTDATYDVYTSVYGVAPKNVAISAGSAVLTFDAQDSALSVKLRVL